MRVAYFDAPAETAESFAKLRVPLDRAEPGDLVCVLDVAGNISPELHEALELCLGGAIGAIGRFHVAKPVDPNTIAALLRDGSLVAIIGEVVE